MSNAVVAGRPLFGSRPDSFLGDRRQFCETIVQKLRAANFPFSDEGDPETLLLSCQKDEILRAATEADITLDDLIPIPRSLSASDIAQLIEAAKSDGVSAMSSEGAGPPDDSIARVLLQLRGLDDVCGPTRGWLPGQKEVISRLREKHRHILQNQPS